MDRRRVPCHRVAQGSHTSPCGSAENIGLELNLSNQVDCLSSEWVPNREISPDGYPQDAAEGKGFDAVAVPLSILPVLQFTHRVTAQHETNPTPQLSAFTHLLPADVDFAYADGKSDNVHIREPFRLFPGPDLTIPTSRLRILTDTNGFIIYSHLTGEDLYDIKFLPPRLDAYEDVKADRLEKYYAWGADRLRDIVPRLVNVKPYYKTVNGDQEYDKIVTIQNAKNALSMTLQRSRQLIKGGLLNRYVVGKGVFLDYLFTEQVDSNGDTAKVLIPMENILFGVRIELEIDLDRMVFTDLNGRDHPLFTPREVPPKAANALRGEHDVEPPTLDDLFNKWPHVRGYQDTLHPLMDRRTQEELQMRVDAELEAAAEMRKQYRPSNNNEQYFRVKRKAEDNQAPPKKKVKRSDPEQAAANDEDRGAQNIIAPSSNDFDSRQSVLQTYSHSPAPQLHQLSYMQVFSYTDQQNNRFTYDQQVLHHEAQQQTDEQNIGNQSPQQWQLQQPLVPYGNHSSPIYEPTPTNPRLRQTPSALEDVAAATTNALLLDPDLEDWTIAPGEPPEHTDPDMNFDWEAEQQFQAELARFTYLADEPSPLEHSLERRSEHVEEGEEFYNLVEPKVVDD